MQPSSSSSSSSSSVSAQISTAVDGMPTVLGALIGDEYLLDTAVFDEIRGNTSALTDALQGRFVKLLSDPSYRFTYSEVSSVHQALYKRRIEKKKSGSDLNELELKLFNLAKGIFDEKLSSLDGIVTKIAEQNKRYFDSIGAWTKVCFGRIDEWMKARSSSSSSSADAERDQIAAELLKQLEAVKKSAADFQRLLGERIFAIDEPMSTTRMIEVNAQLSSFKAQAKMLCANMRAVDKTDVSNAFATKDLYLHVIRGLYDDMARRFTEKLTQYRDDIIAKLGTFDTRMARSQDIPSEDLLDLQMGINRFCQGKELADSVLSVLQELRMDEECERVSVQAPQQKELTVDSELKTLKADLETVLEQVLQADFGNKESVLKLIVGKQAAVKAITAKLEQQEVKQAIKIRAELLEIVANFQSQVASIGQARLTLANEAAVEQIAQVRTPGFVLTPQVMLQLKLKMEQVNKSALFATELLQASRDLALAVSA